MTPQDEADSMLEDTVPQHMDMENLGEHSDQASSALELSSASCITSTVTAGTSSRAEGKNVVEPLPLPPPPSVVGCISGKGDEPHVVTEEELQQQASAAIVNGKVWLQLLSVLVADDSRQHMIHMGRYISGSGFVVVDAV